MGNTSLLGAWGESVTADYLRRHGYTVLEANYHCRYGEIDLIARSRKHLVFVEVKLRKSDSFAQAREYVDARKQSRIKTTAAFYLSAHNLDLPVRFDVAEIYAPRGLETEKPVINYLEDAFE